MFGCRPHTNHSGGKPRLPAARWYRTVFVQRLPCPRTANRRVTQGEVNQAVAVRAPPQAVQQAARCTVVHNDQLCTTDTRATCADELCHRARYFTQCGQFAPLKLKSEGASNAGLSQTQQSFRSDLRALHPGPNAIVQPILGHLGPL